MSTDTEAEPTSLPGRVLDAVNRSEIDQLISRHFISPDDGRSDREWLESVYIEDFTIVLPHGTYEGYEGMARAIEASGTIFERSHHLIANNVIELEGETASIRSKLIATHLVRADEPHNAYTGGAEYDFRAVLTDGGWRLARAEYKGVWTRGEPPRVSAE